MQAVVFGVWALEFVGFIFLIVGVFLKSTMVCAAIHLNMFEALDIIKGISPV